MSEYEMNGIHASVIDDSSQFVDLWLNTDGNITIKVSNGRPWRPMWVVAHANFFSGNESVGKQDYHVYCPSPNPGGHGAETWFKFGAPPISGEVTRIVLSSNKEKPWKDPEPDWQFWISVSRSMP